MEKTKFCPNCGKLLHIKNEDGKKTGKCTCGFTKETDLEIAFTEKSRKIEERGEGVREGKDNLVKFPHVCKKCGYAQAEVIDLGAPYSDESNIYLFMCGKCGYVERQADGSSNK